MIEDNTTDLNESESNTIKYVRSNVPRIMSDAQFTQGYLQDPATIVMSNAFKLKAFDGGLIVPTKYDFQQKYKGILRFKDVEVLHDDVLTDIKLLPDNITIGSLVKDVYLQDLPENLNRIHRNAPKFFKEKFIDSAIGFYLYQKYYYILSLINFVDKHRKDPALKELKDLHIYLEWIAPRKSESIDFILRGPISNQNYNINFVEHYEVLVSPSQKMENIIAYQQLVSTQATAVSIEEVRQEIEHRANSYNKLADVARTYLVNVYSNDGVSVTTDNDNNLVFDCSSVEIGNTYGEDSSKKYDDLGTEITSNEVHSRMTINKLKKLFNDYSRLRINKLMFDTDVYYTHLDSIDNMFVVFPGIRCDTRYSHGEHNNFNNSLAIAGKFTRVGTQYQFIQSSEAITFNIGTDVKNFQFFIVPGKGEGKLAFNDLLITVRKWNIFQYPITTGYTTRIKRTKRVAEIVENVTRVYGRVNRKENYEKENGGESNTYITGEGNELSNLSSENMNITNGVVNANGRMNLLKNKDSAYTVDSNGDVKINYSNRFNRNASMNDDREKQLHKISGLINEYRPVLAQSEVDELIIRTNTIINSGDMTNGNDAAKVYRLASDLVKKMTTNTTTKDLLTVVWKKLYAMSEQLKTNGDKDNTADSPSLELVRLHMAYLKNILNKIVGIKALNAENTISINEALAKSEPFTKMQLLKGFAIKNIDMKLVTGNDGSVPNDLKQKLLEMFSKIIYSRSLPYANLNDDSSVSDVMKNIFDKEYPNIGAGWIVNVAKFEEYDPTSSFSKSNFEYLTDNAVDGGKELKISDIVSLAKDFIGNDIASSIQREYADSSNRNTGTEPSYVITEEDYLVAYKKSLSDDLNEIINDDDLFSSVLNNEVDNKTSIDSWIHDYDYYITHASPVYTNSYNYVDGKKEINSYIEENDDSKYVEDNINDLCYIERLVGDADNGNLPMKHDVCFMYSQHEHLIQQMPFSLDSDNFSDEFKFNNDYVSVNGNYYLFYKEPTDVAFVYVNIDNYSYQYAYKLTNLYKPVSNGEEVEGALDGQYRYDIISSSSDSGTSSSFSNADTYIVLNYDDVEKREIVAVSGVSNLYKYLDENNNWVYFWLIQTPSLSSNGVVVACYSGKYYSQLFSGTANFSYVKIDGTTYVFRPTYDDYSTHYRFSLFPGIGYEIATGKSNVYKAYSVNNEMTYYYWKDTDYHKSLLLTSFGELKRRIIEDELNFKRTDGYVIYKKSDQNQITVQDADLTVNSTEIKLTYDDGNSVSTDDIYIRKYDSKIEQASLAIYDGVGEMNTVTGVVTFASDQENASTFGSGKPIDNKAAEITIMFGDGVRVIFRFEYVNYESSSIYQNDKGYLLVYNMENVTNYDTLEVIEAGAPIGMITNSGDTFYYNNVAYTVNYDVEITEAGIETGIDGIITITSISVLYIDDISYGFLKYSNHIVRVEMNSMKFSNDVTYTLQAANANINIASANNINTENLVFPFTKYMFNICDYIKIVDENNRFLMIVKNESQQNHDSSEYYVRYSTNMNDEIKMVNFDSKLLCEFVGENYIIVNNTPHSVTYENRHIDKDITLIPSVNKMTLSLEFS